MRKENPACYECPKGGYKALHHWKRNTDGTATCMKCEQVLNQLDATDCFEDTSAR